jgi:hypothetical protein
MATIYRIIALDVNDHEFLKVDSVLDRQNPDKSVDMILERGNGVYNDVFLILPGKQRTIIARYWR